MSKKKYGWGLAWLIAIPFFPIFLLVELCKQQDRGRGGVRRRRYR